MTGVYSCILILSLVYVTLLLYIRDIDEDNMDSYDRYHGIAGEGRTRGVLGTIYDAEGHVDVWRTITNHNPYWL